MGKKTTIGSAAILSLVAVSVFTYSHLIGFERTALSSKIPNDAYAYLSIRHIRKAGFAFATDSQLNSAFDVIQAIAKIIDDSSSGPIFPTTDAEIDEQLLADLGKHFKTQLALTALPSSSQDEALIDFALVADFYGSSTTFASILHELARQASTPEVSYRWSTSDALGVSYQQLTIDSETEQPIHPCWTVYNDAFYLCSSSHALERLIRHAQSEVSQSINSHIRRHNAEAYLSAPDLTLYINSRPSVELVASLVEKSLIKSGGLTASLNPKTLVQELGLNEIESILWSSTLSSSKRTYAGVTYTQAKGLLAAVHPFDSTLQQPQENSSISAFESLNINFGEALLTIKNAILKAAPLANFPYYGINAKVLAASGQPLEEILKNAFHSQASFLQTVDIGTARNPYGEIDQHLVHDFALKFSLQKGQSLIQLIESQIPALLANSTGRAYREDNVLHIDTDVDQSITSGRFALAYDNESLTLGYGTLKSFFSLKQQQESYSQNASTAAPLIGVGNGSLSLQRLPTTLFQLTTVFYQQVNPGKPIPEEFLRADWGALTALEQERTSTTFLDANGRLFRISEQRSEN